MTSKTFSRQEFTHQEKGEPIDPEKPIDLQRIRMFTSDATRIWHTHIVMSLNKPDRLPINTLNGKLRYKMYLHKLTFLQRM